MSTIITYQGKQFDYLAPTAEMVSIDDILCALPRINRFVGHSSRAYSVAEHTFFCLVMAEELEYTTREQLLVLIHDFTEAYVSDCPSPLKNLLPDFSAIEENVEKAICEYIGIEPPTDEEFIKIKKIDMTMLVVEMKQLTHHDWNDFPSDTIYAEYLDSPIFDLSEPLHEDLAKDILKESYERILNSLAQEKVLI